MTVWTFKEPSLGCLLRINSRARGTTLQLVRSQLDSETFQEFSPASQRSVYLFADPQGTILSSVDGLLQRRYAAYSIETISLILLLRAWSHRKQFPTEFVRVCSDVLCKNLPRSLQRCLCLPADPQHTNPFHSSLVGHWSCRNHFCTSIFVCQFAGENHFHFRK